MSPDFLSYEITFWLYIFNQSTYTLWRYILFIYLSIYHRGRSRFWIKQTANSTQPRLWTIYIYRDWRVERYWLAGEVYCIRTYLNCSRLSVTRGCGGAWSAVVRISIPFILSSAVIVFGQIVMDIIYLFLCIFSNLYRRKCLKS